MKPISVATAIIRVSLREEIIWNERMNAFKLFGEAFLHELGLDSTRVSYIDLSEMTPTEGTLRIFGVKRCEESYFRGVLDKVFSNWDSKDIHIEEVEISFDFEGEEYDFLIENKKKDPHNPV